MGSALSVKPLASAADCEGFVWQLHSVWTRFGLGITRFRGRNYHNEIGLDSAWARFRSVRLSASRADREGFVWQLHSVWTRFGLGITRFCGRTYQN